MAISVINADLVLFNELGLGRWSSGVLLTGVVGTDITRTSGGDCICVTKSLCTGTVGSHSHLNVLTQ